MESMFPPSSPPVATKSTVGSKDAASDAAAALLPAFSVPSAKKSAMDAISIYRDVAHDFYPSPLPTSERNDTRSSSPPRVSASSDVEDEILRPQVNADASENAHTVARSEFSTANIQLRALKAMVVVRVPLSGEPVLLGRSSQSCEFALRATNKLASRVHAQVSYCKDQDLIKIICMGWNGLTVGVPDAPRPTKQYDVVKDQSIYIEAVEGISINIHGDRALVELEKPQPSDASDDSADATEDELPSSPEQIGHLAREDTIDEPFNEVEERESTEKPEEVEEREQQRPEPQEREEPGVRLLFDKPWQASSNIRRRNTRPKTRSDAVKHVSPVVAKSGDSNKTSKPSEMSSQSEIPKDVAKPAVVESFKKVVKPAVVESFKKVVKPAVTESPKEVAKPAMTESSKKVAKPAVVESSKKVDKPATTESPKEVAKPAMIESSKKAVKPATTESSEKVAKSAVVEPSETKPEPEVESLKLPKPSKVEPTKAEPTKTDAKPSKAEPAKTDAKVEPPKVASHKAETAKTETSRAEAVAKTAKPSTVTEARDEIDTPVKTETKSNDEERRRKRRKPQPKLRLNPPRALKRVARDEDTNTKRLRQEEEEEIANIVVNLLAFSRLSTTPLSTIKSSSARLGSVPKSELRRILEAQACVGVITAEGVDWAGRPLEPEYYYNVDNDPNEQRRQMVETAANHRSLRNCRRSTHKEFFYYTKQ